jgi:hypothetical protein
VADCDCLTPAVLSVFGHMAWNAPKEYSVRGVPGYEGFNLGAFRSEDKRFAIGITLPPFEQGKERIGHAYGLMNTIPRAPQPTIQMPYEGGPWWVIDPSAHWGMKRPPDDYYSTGEFVAFELRRDRLDGLSRR